MRIDAVLQAATNVVAAVIGIFVGLAIADFPGFEAWLRDWQTLLAGVLAIVAAGLTIVAMLRTDQSQQRRHDQLVGITLKPAKLRLQRAASTALRVSQNIENMAPSSIGALRSLNAGDADAVSKALSSALFMSTMLKAFVDNPDIDSAKDDFPVEIMQAHKTALLWTMTFRTHPAIVTGDHHIFASNAGELAGLLDVSQKTVDIFAREIDELARS